MCEYCGNPSVDKHLASYVIILVSQTVNDIYCLHHQSG